MPGKSSHRKGADGERELAALLREYGYPVERGGSLSFGEAPDLTGLPRIHIECKRAEQLRPYDWIARRSGTLCGLVTVSPPCSSAAPARRGWW